MIDDSEHLNLLIVLARDQGMTVSGLVKSPQFNGMFLRAKSQRNEELCKWWEALTEERKLHILELAPKG